MTFLLPLLIGIFIGTFVGFFIASLCRSCSCDGPVMPAVRNWDEATFTPDVPDQASRLRELFENQN